MATISTTPPIGVQPQAAASSPRLARPAQEGPADVLVLPAHARSLSEARAEIEKAKGLMKELGARVKKDLPSSGGFKARLDTVQREKLEKAGFQTVEDTRVKVVPPNPAAGSSGNLTPGWLLTPKGLEASGRAVDEASKPGEVDLGALPAESSSSAGSSVSAQGALGWPFEERSPAYPPGFSPFPFLGRERAPQAEGPSDFVGDLPTTGKGVTIAILDSGLYPHPDLDGRILKLVSAVGGRTGHPDSMGHGTHVASDAAGSGKLSQGRLRGPAPDASLVGIQVLEGEGEGDLSEVVEQLTAGIDWMVENKDQYNIRVANLSLGMPLIESRRGWFGPATLYDPIGAAINRAVEAGITVVVAAGNEGGEPGTINGSPAINDNVITVGALDTNGTPNDRSDDRVADFSSRGPTPDGRVKPDVVAPGVNIMAAVSPGSMLEQQNEQIGIIREKIQDMGPRELQKMAYMLVRYGMAPSAILRLHPEEMRELLLQGLETHQTEGRLEDGPAYIAMDGTSMASPIVAGVVAAMIEANPRLTPEEVKIILMKTSDKLPGVRATDQGAGVINAQRAVAVAAESARRQA